MYIDLLTKIKNAQRAGKERLKVVYTNNDNAVAELLAKAGFIESVAKKGRLPKRILEIRPKYENEQGAITDIKFISRPSRHIYIGYRDLRSVRQGYGLGVISTPQGIMTTKEARKMKVGGELLFEIW